MVVSSGISIPHHKSHPQAKRSVSTDTGRLVISRRTHRMTAVIITALICATLLGLVWLSK